MKLLSRTLALSVLAFGSTAMAVPITADDVDSVAESAVGSSTADLVATTLDAGEPMTFVSATGGDGYQLSTFNSYASFCAVGPTQGNTSWSCDPTTSTVTSVPEPGTWLLLLGGLALLTLRSRRPALQPLRA